MSPLYLFLFEPAFFFLEAFFFVAFFLAILFVFSIDLSEVRLINLTEPLYSLLTCEHNPSGLEADRLSGVEASRSEGLN